jgi:hypothetical protein
MYYWRSKSKFCIKVFAEYHLCLNLRPDRCFKTALKNAAHDLAVVIKKVVCAEGDDMLCGIAA